MTWISVLSLVFVSLIVVSMILVVHQSLQTIAISRETIAIYREIERDAQARIARIAKGAR